MGGCKLRDRQHPGWTTAKYGHYNSCEINSGRKPTRLALRSPGNFFGTSEQAEGSYSSCSRHLHKSSNKPKEVWRIIHRILKPNQQPLRQDPDKLNSFFACTAKRTLPVSSDLPFCLEELIESLPEKTKTMLLSTSQMSHVHSLDKNRLAITISDST